MNESRHHKKGRPKKHVGTDIKLHVLVDETLWNAVHDPKCSQSYTLTRALRQCLNEGRRDNVPAIRIAWIEARKEIAHGNAVISDCRDRLRRMGVDLKEFEDSLMEE